MIGTRPACRPLGVAPATIYRRRRPPEPREKKPRQPPARALSEAEREEVLGVLHAEPHVDASPAQVWATLLDQGRYLCSVRTMYRILSARGEVHERRDHLVHPAFVKPELLAERPNQLLSWDITKPLGPAKAASLAKALIAQAISQQGIQSGQLTTHADRGSAMRSKPVAFLLADLGVTKTHSRPYTSADNPYSEAQFRTMKYRPGFPDSFGSIEHARDYCRPFFDWYNHDHRHSGIGLMTPAAVHYGHANAMYDTRAP